MATIKITCDTCNKTHEVNRTKEIPTHVISMGCNWCPCCEDKAQGYYEEWYNENEGGNNSDNAIPKNQLAMPFIFDEIGENVTQIETHENNKNASLSPERARIEKQH